MAEWAGVDRETITAWSRRATQLRGWAAHTLHIIHRVQLMLNELTVDGVRPSES